MPRSEQRRYLTRRARESRIARDAAVEPGSRLAHGQLALAYEALSKAEGPDPTLPAVPLDAAQSPPMTASASDRAA